MTDKISVIVPVYKVEKYLDRCVSSLVNQSYKNLEIILVDDASPDSCPAICDRWAQRDERIRVIHKKNEGVSKARRCGAQASTGDYIAFVDSDDWVRDNMFEQLHSLINSGEYNIACCGYELVTDSNEISDSSQGKAQVLDFAGMIKGIYDYNLWSVCFKLYRRELFDITDLPEIDLTVCEDLLLNYYIFKHCDKIIVSDRKDYFYFRHPESVMSGNANERYITDSLTAYRTISDDFDISSPAYSYQAANRVKNDFRLINEIIKHKQDKKLYNAVRDDLLSQKKYVFKKENSYCFSIFNKLATILLTVCPAIYNLLIKIKG